MKRLYYIAALAAVLPLCAQAQVEKRVEVTKAYVPSVESASKLPVVPDMTDTVKLRPEINYVITPLSIQTALATRPIRPATVTYWEFNRPLPFYLKIGAGYPLNSVADFYASSQNPGTGYVVGYINHEGRYDDIKNLPGIKNKSTRMLNRVGASAGKYLGRHVLEGDLSYENRMYHRYGTFAEDYTLPHLKPGSMVDFGDANVALRVGDDFQDLSRLNFEVAVRGGMFFDHSRWLDDSLRGRQLTLETHAKIAGAFGRNRLGAEVGYEYLDGQKSIDNHSQQLVHAAVRYGISGGVVRLEAGADYYHDKIKSEKAENYFLPFLRLNFNLGTDGLCPFFEIDGQVSPNDFRALTQLNPYLTQPTFGAKSSVDYNGRFGVAGSLWHSKFDYRVYAGFSVLDHHLYWYGTGLQEENAGVYSAATMSFEQGRQTVFSYNANLTWRPASSFRADVEIHGYFYNNKESDHLSGAPNFKGSFSARYEGRKVSLGAGVDLLGSRKWSDVWNEKFDADRSALTFKAPFGVDLHLDFDWRISGGVTLFAEGHNLLNRKLYTFPLYPEYGANFTAGVKLNF